MKKEQKDYIKKKNRLIVDNYVLVYTNIIKLLDDSSVKNQEIISMAKEPIIPSGNAYGGYDVPASRYIMFVDEMLKKTYPTLLTPQERFRHAGLQYMADYYNLIPQIDKAKEGERLILDIRSYSNRINELQDNCYYSTRDNDDRWFRDSLKELKKHIEKAVNKYEQLCELYPESYMERNFLSGGLL